MMKDGGEIPAEDRMLDVASSDNNAASNVFEDEFDDIDLNEGNNLGNILGYLVALTQNIIPNLLLRKQKRSKFDIQPYIIILSMNFILSMKC